MSIFPTNEDRAAWAELALDEFCLAVFGRDFADTAKTEGADVPVGDLLCNMMHLCQRQGVDFQAMITRAEMHFEAEVEEEEESA